jgi:hypothetical protein
MLAQTVEQVPRFIIALDAPAAAEVAPVRVPLAITGKWVRGATEFAITRRDLEAIVRNFQARLNGEINVDYDHASEMPEVAAGGPIPSAGRIVRLDEPEQVTGDRLQVTGNKPDTGHRTPGTYILWGRYEPTARARELIRRREYRYISPAIDWAARGKRDGKPQGATLTSVALTNRPFLEELPAIRLSDPAYVSADAPDIPPRSADLEGPRQPASFDFRISSFQFPVSNSGGTMKHANLSVQDGKIHVTHEDFQDAYVLASDELTRCLEELGPAGGPTVTAGFSPTLASELQTLAGLPGASAAECLAEITARLAGRREISLAQASTLLSETEARGKVVPAAEVFRAQVNQALDEGVARGAILPRQREDWRKIALSDFPTFRKLLGEQKPRVPLRPAGFASAPPEDVPTQVKLLVEQRCRERHISFGQALTEIGREHPDLVREYRRAVSSAE